MHLQEIYARFYRSLNYDYLRASHDEYDPSPWDSTPSGADYPFVRLRLEPDITTVVGGNESGKSQVLRAITAALTGTGYDRSDFCRYSAFFGADARIVEPEFGALYSNITAEEIVKFADRANAAKLHKLKRWQGLSCCRRVCRSLDRIIVAGTVCFVK